jgi:HEPN domain-containing protein
MLTKSDLQKLAEMRMSEAVVLCEAGHFSGAYYLAGYAAELALKACIASSFRPNTIPDKKLVNDIYTHRVQDLVRLAGLEAERTTRAKDDLAFAENWEYVQAWSEDKRYAFINEQDARLLIEALRDRSHGVFEWIKTHW